MTATQIGGVVFYVKKLIADGKTEQALRYAQGKGFENLEVLLNRGNPNRGKWPEHCRAEVWSHCLNKRLMVVKLPDRRKASCWRGRARNPIGAKIFVKLLSATGDPIYETTLEEPVSDVV
jgi:hypothetical protein